MTSLGVIRDQWGWPRARATTKDIVPITAFIISSIHVIERIGYVSNIVIKL